MKKGSKKGTKKATGRRKLTPREEKFTEGVLRHGNATKAALDAGYSPKSARVTASRKLTKANIRARIQERVAESKVETNEIIGTLASQMRADLADILPEDEILKRAKENGVSHLIKKLKTHTRLIPQKGEDEDGNPLPPIKEVTCEFEMYSALEAAKQLSVIKGLMKEPQRNPFDAARDTLKRILEETQLEEGRARKIVAARFGVPESELIISKEVN